MLADDLNSLLSQVQAQFHELHRANQLILRRELFIKPTYDSLKQESGNISSSIHSSYVQIDEWDISDQLRFSKSFEANPNYSKIYKALINNYKLEDSISRSHIDSLIRFYAHRLYEASSKDNEPLTAITPIDTLEIFIADINNNAINWHVKAGLKGVWIEDEPCNVNDFISLRQIRVDDLDNPKPAYELAFANMGFHVAIPQSPTVLEFQERAIDSNKVRETVNAIMGVLSLYKIGSLSTTYVDVRPDSILRHGYSTSGGLNTDGPFKYGIKANESTQLTNFYKTLLPMIEPLTTFSSFESSSSLKIAYDRYQDAIHQVGAIEKRITSAITCLESLLLKTKERAELAHRLAQRTSIICRIFGFRPIEVYQNILKAYDIRSTYIHGGTVTAESKPTLEPLSVEVMRYCRTCFLVLIQSSSDGEKEQFIKKLDNALLDRSAANKLEDQIKSNVFIPESSN